MPCEDQSNDFLKSAQSFALFFVCAVAVWSLILQIEETK